MNTETNSKGINLNKPAYVIFVLVAIYFLLVKDFGQAVVFAGIALVFDPFNIEVPFQKRPLYQRLWLIAHLCTTIVMFVLLINGK